MDLSKSNQNITTLLKLNDDSMTTYQYLAFTFSDYYVINSILSSLHFIV